MRRTSWLALGVLGLSAYAALRALAASSRRKILGEPAPGAPRIVVLGAGFAGLSAADKLGQRLGGRAMIQLIDRHNYHVFTPLLFQVATCAVNPYDVAFPVRQYLNHHGVAFRQGTVTGIDLETRRVLLRDGLVDYDYLIVALGSTTNFFGLQDAEQYALPLKSLEDAVAIRHKVVDALEEATRTLGAAKRRALLTFVVVGGGATGVETAAALADTLRQVLPRAYPSLDPNEAMVIVIELERKLLGHMSDRLADLALDRLARMGVRVWLNARARAVTADSVMTEDGRTVRTQTIIWATGVRTSDVVASLKAQHGKGESLAVDEYLRVRGRPEVYAIGDNAHVVDSLTRESAPLMAQAAIREGAMAAENLARALEGRSQVPFHYRSLGNAISLGRSAGAVEVAGLVADGFLGGLGALSIHLFRMPGLRNRLATALDWGINYLEAQDTARLDLAAPSLALQARRVQE